MESTESSLAPEILLIGYGNELRGDDAAGPIIAEKIEAMRLPGIRVIVCHQLTPELAEDIAGARVVIFVDASVEIDGDTARAMRIEPNPAAQLQGHLGDPRALLYLAQSLYGQAPMAWCVHVPAMEFELGAKPSRMAAHGIETAIELILSLIEGR
jgi:hydrogenase maturation protease